MAELPQWKKIGVVSASAVLCGFLGCLYLLIPVTEKWKALSGEVSRRERQLRKSSLLARQREELSAQWKAIVRAAPSSPLDEKDGMALVREIERCAKGAGVGIVDLKPARSDASGDENSTTGVHLSLKGNWSSQLGFLERIRNSSMGLFVESFHVQRAEEDGSMLKAILSIKEI